MNVSSRVSASWFVVIVPLPLVAPEAIAMLVSVPWSSGSAVPSVIVSGIVTMLDSARDSRAVTVTSSPSGTGLGAADRVTAGAQDVLMLRATVSPSLHPATVVLHLAKLLSATLLKSWAADENVSAVVPTQKL